MHLPQTLFRRFAVAEAITWALLLAGMFFKYVTHTTDLGVRVFGMVHGIVFIAYCLVAVFVGVNQRWRVGTLLLGLLAAVPPFATILFERRMARTGRLDGDWRLGRGGETPVTLPERVVAWCLARPVAAAGVGVLAVAALTALALAVGPPASRG